MTPAQARAKQAREILSAVGSFGIKVPGGSRLHRMQRTLANADGTPVASIRPQDADFNIALEAVRDLQQLGFALSQFCPAEVGDAFLHKLRKAVHDPTLPEDNLERSHGRDAQCELYVAGICKKAGFNPIFAEPDLHCFFENVSIGLAIKRIKSYKAFQDRISEAADQIFKSNLSGAIVADVSVMLNPENERIVATVNDRQYQQIANEAMFSFANAHAEKMLRWTEGKHVLGFFLLDHHVRQHPVVGWCLECFTFSDHLVPYNTRRQRFFYRFATQFSRGLSTPPQSGELNVNI